MLPDSNVVSELVRPAPGPNVLRFIQGQRRRDLEQAVGTFIKVGLSNRVLVFDEACANGYAMARATREAAGRPISAQDAMIGGMALAHGATMVTRNTADFAGHGLVVVNPWQVLGQPSGAAP